MAEWLDPQKRQARGGVETAGVGTDAGEAVVFDEGLRSHMLKVYNYMASGVLLTGIVAMLFAQTEFAQNLMINGGILSWVILLSPLAFILAMSFGINRMSTATLQLCFWAFATVMGLSMARIFMMFSGESIAQTFFATAAAFAALSLWGYTTKKDLSGWGSFLIMGVVGLIIASVANIWFASGTMHWVISFAGVLIFAGLTAYDTQRIKREYYHFRGTETLGKIAIMGALNLYLDFVNMFQFLLSFMGGSD
ncbi:MAG: Bax inhibitor-1/YccA family protein [Sphingorhabdus sp.]